MLRNTYTLLSIVFCIAGIVCFVSGGLMGIIVAAGWTTKHATIHGYLVPWIMTWAGVLGLALAFLFGKTSDSL